MLNAGKLRVFFKVKLSLYFSALYLHAKSPLYQLVCAQNTTYPRIIIGQWSNVHVLKILSGNNIWLSLVLKAQNLLKSSENMNQVIY